MKKNINTNENFLYTGNVYIKYKYENSYKNIQKHNEGKIPLFTAITLALGGRTADAETKKPNYLMGKDASDLPCFSHKVVVQNISYYSGTALSDGGENDRIRYLFVVPSSLLIRGNEIKKLCLINNDNEECAEIILNDSETISTNLSASLMVYWDLSFTNAATSL